MRASFAAMVVCALVSVGCNSNPTAPSSGAIPNVAGTYSGTLAWDVDGQRLANLPTRIVVVQSGSQLTITGALTVEGTTINLPAVTGVVNETGFFTATGGGVGGSVDDPSCGLITPISTSLTFSGNTARYVENDNTQFCGQWAFSGTLTR